MPGRSMPMIRTPAVGVRAGLDRDLAPRPGRAVHPDDRRPAPRAVLGEAQPTVSAHGDRPLEGRSLHLAHADRVSQPYGGRVDRRCRDRTRAQQAAPSPTTSGPSTTSSTTQVMLSLPPAAQRCVGEHRGRGVRVAQTEHLADPVVVDQIGQPVGAQQQPVPRPQIEIDQVRRLPPRPSAPPSRERSTTLRHGCRIACSGQLTGVEQVLDVGVVTADLAQQPPSRR